MKQEEESKQVGYIRKVGIVLGIILFGVLMYPKMTARAFDTSSIQVVAELNVTNSQYGFVPTEKGDESINNHKAIQKALDDVKNYPCGPGQYVKVIVPAGDYYIGTKLKVHSNTYLKLEDGARIRNSLSRNIGSMISNYHEDSSTVYSGYTGASYIIIEGGTWDARGDELQAEYKARTGDNMGSFTNVLFGHANNIVIQNTKILNNYAGHLIEMAGVRDSEINGCQLSTYYGADQKKEAIQLDITHDSTMFPTFSGYDDTVCDNIKITNNTIENYSRGIGSHVAVKGIHNKNIYIAGNTFKNIQYEGVLAYLYRKMTVENNTFSNVGIGVDVRTTSTNEKNDLKNPLNGDTSNYVLSDSEILIQNNIIEGMKATSNKTMSKGINIWAKSSNRLRGVKVLNNTIRVYNDAIYLKYPSGALIQGNTITSSYRGIYLQYGTSDLIEGNTITAARYSGIISNASTKQLTVQNNAAYASNYSIYMANNKTATISNNTVTGKSYGVYIASSSGMNVTGNNIKGTGKYGLYATKTNQSTIASNKLSKTKAASIYMYNSCNSNNILSNSISGSSSYGVVINKNVNNTNINGNTITKNGGKGITISGSSNVTADSNKIESNKSYGIEVNEKSNTIALSKNKVAKNSKIGVYVNTGCKAVTLWKNTIESNKQNGIMFKESVTSSKIHNNVVKNNKKVGIYINKKCKNMIVTSNRITSNGSNGITVSDSVTNTKLKDNTIKKNNNHGIYVSNCTTVKINNNKLSGNQGTAISLKKTKKSNCNSISKDAVKKVSAKTKKVTGKVPKRATVIVKVGKKSYKASVNKQGNYTSKKIASLKAKKVVNVLIKDKAKNEITITKKAS